MLPETEGPATGCGEALLETCSGKNGPRDSKPNKNCKRSLGRREPPSHRPLAGYLNLNFPPHARLPGRGVWERDEAYPEIVRVGDLRVIECRDGIQWILQRRRRDGRWIDLGYFRNRDVLI